MKREMPTETIVAKRPEAVFYLNHQMKPAGLIIALIFSFTLCGNILAALDSAASRLSDEQRSTIALEVLSRLPNADLEKNPAFKNTVNKILAHTRGTPSFVRLVKQLQLTNQNERLLEVARKFPNSEGGVEAMRMILATGDSALLEKSLRSDEAGKIAEALGNTVSKDSLPWLLPLVTDTTRDLALRKQAVRSVARTAGGATALLGLAKQEKLPMDLKLVAGAELNNGRWEKIKTEAAQIFPPPQSREAKALPVISELLRMKGDAANGEKVFFRTESACSACHKIKGRGMEIGPALTEIGDKLGREALFDSILEPSAGISFGYEAYQVELNSGDEAYGLIVSDTADELVMKDLKGIVARYKTSEVAKRQQLKTSLMPTGLQQTMTAQELVDLVEFLSTSRKAK